MDPRKGTKGFSTCGAPQSFFLSPSKHPMPWVPALVSGRWNSSLPAREGTGWTRRVPRPALVLRSAWSIRGSGSPRQPQRPPRAEEAAAALTQLPSFRQHLLMSGDLAKAPRCPGSPKGNPEGEETRPAMCPIRTPDGSPGPPKTTWPPLPPSCGGRGVWEGSSEDESPSLSQS